MRMWNVDPSKLCNQHLLGEHVEMHMFIGALRTGQSLTGYIQGGLVEPFNIWSRHDELAGEMIKRGMQHNSPLPVIDLPKDIAYGQIDLEANKIELRRRCSKCTF